MPSTALESGEGKIEAINLARYTYNTYNCPERRLPLKGKGVPASTEKQALDDRNRRKREVKEHLKHLASTVQGQPDHGLP